RPPLAIKTGKACVCSGPEDLSAVSAGRLDEASDKVARQPGFEVVSGPPAALQPGQSAPERANPERPVFSCCLHHSQHYLVRQTRPFIVGRPLAVFEFADSAAESTYPDSVSPIG